MRVLLAIIFPPLAVVDKGCGSFLITFILTCCGWVLAVVDKGCGSFLITFILTCCGWVPGVIAALVILNKDS